MGAICCKPSGKEKKQYKVDTPIKQEKVNNSPGKQVQKSPQVKPVQKKEEKPLSPVKKQNPIPAAVVKRVDAAPAVAQKQDAQSSGMKRDQTKAGMKKDTTPTKVQKLEVKSGHSRKRSSIPEDQKAESPVLYNQVLQQKQKVVKKVFVQPAQVAIAPLPPPVEPPKRYQRDRSDSRKKDESPGLFQKKRDSQVKVVRAKYAVDSPLIEVQQVVVDVVEPTSEQTEFTQVQKVSVIDPQIGSFHNGSVNEYSQIDQKISVIEPHMEQIDQVEVTKPLELIEEDGESLRMPKYNDQTDKPNKVINDASLDRGDNWKSPTDVVQEAQREEEEEEDSIQQKGQTHAIEEVSPIIVQEELNQYQANYTPIGDLNQSIQIQQIDDKFILCYSLLELQKMAMAESLPELKKRVVQEKKKLRGQGLGEEELPPYLMELERQFQEKLLLQEKEQLIELRIVPNRQEPNEEFDDYYENEIMKDSSISDVSKSYKDIEYAIRLVFNAESYEEDDISEIRALNLTQMNSDQFNNFIFFYYCAINKYIFERIQQEVVKKPKNDQETPTTGMDGSGDENDDQNAVKVGNITLSQIVNDVPKQEIVFKVLEHLGLKDEKIYDLDIYLQKLSYVFTETYLSDKGQVNIIEALEQAQLRFVNYLLCQQDLGTEGNEEFQVNSFTKYNDVNIKLVSQNDPYQLELTEDSLLLDYFMKYFTKSNTNHIQSDDDQMQSEETEQTRQVEVEEVEINDVVKVQLSRQVTHFQRRFNPHASVLEMNDDES